MKRIRRFYGFPRDIYLPKIAILKNDLVILGEILIERNESHECSLFSSLGSSDLKAFCIRAGESQQAGQPDGDAGDPYNGYDRFGRTVDIHWSKPIG